MNPQKSQRASGETKGTKSEQQSAVGEVEAITNNGNVLEAFTDLAAYPILTEEVGYPPSPVATPSGVPGAAPGAAPIGQIAAKAISDVLGWKPKPGDTKGFIGALNASFSCVEVEGHTECNWTPRTYAVQTDLSGGITGAQASIYSRAKDALDQSLPLLQGLTALDSEADPEDVAALKAVIQGQLTELVGELGVLGGPRVSRVNQYFQLLLGDKTFPASIPPNTSLSSTDPDQIGGTLGRVRDDLGLNFTLQDFVNSVEDEQDVSNFRILSDYVTSLAQSWVNNLGFFGLDTTTPFFGTQLVLLSRQLNVVGESVDEVRFTLDSVFVGPAERQTLQLTFTNDPPMFAEDLFSWIQSFTSNEGPRIVQDGGKFGVHNTFFPIADRLHRLVKEVQHPKKHGLLKAFGTPRVQRALGQLRGELAELVRLAKPIRHDVTPEPDFALSLEVTGVQPSQVSLSSLSGKNAVAVQVRGHGFEIGDRATPKVIFTAKGTPITVDQTYFRSENLLVANLAGVAGFTVGLWDVNVQNPDGKKGFPLPGGFEVT
jgi:hypothetical protein